MLATTLNVEFDADLSWDEKKRSVSNFQQDRAHDEYYAVSVGVKARIVDDGTCRGDFTGRRLDFSSLARSCLISL